MSTLYEELPVIEYPHFSQVPLELEKNLKFRDRVIEQCNDDEFFRSEFMRLCKEDSLFWLSSCVWVFEPRPFPRTLPFIPWPHQIPAWQGMERCLGYIDFGIEKSRGEGASWMILMLALHKWLFIPRFSAGFVSKDEKSVDNPADDGSLFWKLDWILGSPDATRPGMLPSWMIPNFERVVTNHTFTNLDNGATMTGYAATENVATGARKTVFFMDELAKFPTGKDEHAMNSVEPVTESRGLISSPWGPSGVYFDAMHSDSSMKKLRLHWTDNPTRNPGLYKVEIDTTNERRVKLLDHAYWKKKAQENGFPCNTDGDVERLAELILDDSAKNPFGYEFMTTGPFVKHGFPRSPWYDDRCRRPGAKPVGIAQEYDIDYGGAASRYFDINLLTRLQTDTVPPYCYGEMVVPDGVESHRDLENTPFQILHGGRLSLWFTPDPILGNPPQGRNFVIGADIAAGTSGVASSNSALAVIDRLTGEQVAEFAAPNILPEDFADYAVALAYWFLGPEGVPATIIWEANGSSGAQFGKRIADLDFPHIYYRGTTEESDERETKKVGWWSSGKTKPPLLGEWGRALASAECVVASTRCLEEAKFYMNLPNDKIEHIAASTEKDPSGASARHGDRVIANALAWWVVKDYIGGGSSSEAIAVDAPPNSALGRRIRSAKEAKREFAWVPPSQKRVR